MKQTNLFTLILVFLTLNAFAQRPHDGAKGWPLPGEKQTCPTFVMTPVDGETITPQTLIEAIIGEDIQSYNLINFQGTTVENASAGIFTGGVDAGIGLESGIVLSSGYIVNALGPNQYAGVTGVLNLPGDPDLESLIPGFTTYDATVLEFEFVPEFDQIFIQFVFGSDEYNEYVGTAYNDVFGFFLNGVNIALVPGTDDRISINSINNDLNSEYFVDNDQHPGPYCNEMDGFTVVMTVSGAVNPGVTNTIKLAIADAGDDVIDSWVFIGAEGFTGTDPDDPTDPDIPLSNWALLLGMGLIVLFMMIRLRRLI